MDLDQIDRELEDKPKRAYERRKEGDLMGTTTSAADELVEAYAELEHAAARVDAAEWFFIDRMPSGVRELISDPRSTARMKRLKVETCREMEGSGNYDPRPPAAA